ncbi:leucyl/phenylalanyl-tRNA--protein transferase [Permianibacter sp. IMCC34836]|uniref:leucyl/phenylalanyl-tRNA--protein transferase n=1 Tax=Permianibacter fluminis TaxID=2738515 RepID=UPI0015547ECB|nr:leucyl/phenylalanyl-tRNA--protein transferase [Permianibacter fluminis]NQD37829.1 leucyl/phenylalanyl-tRNA--protein transferase [Permianibacter fluminis]
MRITVLKSDSPLPSPERALKDPNGLLAIGGDLSVERLTEAYRNGIFPWFSEGDPILWWSPDPRAVFKLATLQPPASLRKFLRRANWQITLDTAFAEVITACATAPRPGQGGTWITDDMIAAYIQLHRAGIAHSIEVWAGASDSRELVGGLYGIAMGRLFFGESMFSGRSNGSKVALFALAAHLKAHGYVLLDSQVPNAHTRSLGADTMARSEFLRLLRDYIDQPPSGEPWLAGPLALSLG